MLKVYEYKNCGTCKKALKFLEAEGVDYKAIPIRETPPKKTELKKMLGYMDGQIKKLFNTSGQDYRAMGIKDKIADMTDKEAIDLLSQNGNLVKRPFVLGDNWGIVGFKEENWKEHLYN
jgi:arsenate reductase